MFTKNANIYVTQRIGAVGNCLSQNIVTFKGESFTGSNDISNIGNISCSACLQTVKQNGLTYGSSAISNGVYFGTGNVAPTADDYSFSGEMVQNFTSSYTQTITYNTDGSANITTVYTITAPASGDITIGEVCMFVDVTGKAPTYQSSSRAWPVLMERTALETPITIPAGGVGQVTYTITIKSII